MIQIELSQDVERRLYEQAQAQGIEPHSYVRTLIENALRSAPTDPTRSRPARDMKAFFRVMSAGSDNVPSLPDEAFTRESFYQDHER